MDFKNKFPYSDLEILEHGKCIAEDHTIRDVEKILKKMKASELSKNVIKIKGAIGKYGVTKSLMDNYIFYIKNKWINISDQGEEPSQHKLFNVKYADFCHFYREILPKRPSNYGKKKNGTTHNTK